MRKAMMLVFAGLSLLVRAAGPEPAPPLALKSVDGEVHSLSQYQGKLVFLTFFKEGCVPCQKEIPFLSRLAAQYPDYLVVLGVGYQEKDPVKLKATAQSFGARFPVLVDSQGLVARGYHVASLPFGVLIDENGKIIGKWFGFHEQEVQKMVEAGVQRLNVQTKTTAIAVKQFTEVTSAAKQAGLGRKLPQMIAEGLRRQGFQVAGAGAPSAYTVEGSISRIGPVTGVSVRILQTASGLQMEEISQSVTGDDFGPLVAEVAARLKKLP